MYMYLPTATIYVYIMCILLYMQILHITSYQAPDSTTHSSPPHLPLPHTLPHTLTTHTWCTCTWTITHTEHNTGGRIRKWERRHTYIHQHNIILLHTCTCNNPNGLKIYILANSWENYNTCTVYMYMYIHVHAATSDSLTWHSDSGQLHPRSDHITIGNQ